MNCYLIKAYLLIGFFCFTSRSIEAQNLHKADSLIQVYSKGNLDELSALECLEKISYYEPNPDKKLFYAKKLIDLARKASDDLYLLHGYYQAGNAYRLKSDLKEAVNAYFISIKLAEKLQHKGGIAGAYAALGDLYSINGNYNNSTLYYKKAITTFEELGDSTNLGTTLMNAGYDFLQSQEIDSALVYFEKSGKIFQELNYEIGIAYNLMNVGLAYAKLENYTKAEKHLKESTAILEKYSDFYPIAEFNLSMTEIFYQRGDITKALQHALKCLQLSEMHGFKEQIRDASLKLSELYAKTKNYDSAYHYHTKYVAYRDSINNEEVIRKMADLRTEFEVSQKEAEIDLLTKQRQINKLIGLGLVFTTILVSMLAFVLYRNNRTKQATNKILTSQKEELERQHFKLEGLNNTKDRFFSIISHDLRGPVNAFNGISELIKHYIAKNEMAQLREVSEYIDKSARQLSTLLDNLLDWSIRQQGTFPFKVEKIYLNPLLQENAEMFGVTAHSKKIILTVNLEEEIYIWADRNSLNTIIRNLVNNALKFTEAEGLVTISAYTQKEYAMINIIDTGIGIPENKLENLFDLKEKNLSSGTSGEKGLGIGLNLAYEFALMNKGTIIVNSEENAGTIFTVKLPLYPSYSNKDMNPGMKENTRENEPAR